MMKKEILYLATLTTIISTPLLAMDSEHSKAAANHVPAKSEEGAPMAPTVDEVLQKFLIKKIPVAEAVASYTSLETDQQAELKRELASFRLRAAELEAVLNGLSEGTGAAAGHVAVVDAPISPAADEVLSNKFVQSSKRVPVAEAVASYNNLTNDQKAEVKREWALAKKENGNRPKFPQRVAELEAALPELKNALPAGAAGGAPEAVAAAAGHVAAEREEAAPIVADHVAVVEAPMKSAAQELVRQDMVQTSARRTPVAKVVASYNRLTEDQKAEVIREWAMAKQENGGVIMRAPIQRRIAELEAAIPALNPPLAGAAGGAAAGG